MLNYYLCVFGNDDDVFIRQNYEHEFLRFLNSVVLCNTLCSRYRDKIEEKINQK